MYKELRSLLRLAFFFASSPKFPLEYTPKRAIVLLKLHRMTKIELTNYQTKSDEQIVIA